VPERRAYIEAVQCLTKKDAISGMPGAINRFDDHHAVHANQKPNIHWVVSRFFIVLSVAKRHRAILFFGTATLSPRTKKL
jgi:hypothetical protein